ncbi:prolyl oligopeptidase family serine peptidase [Polyangium mundeleinium]|uniref:Prolyl oligopeptidase family serine peptidase n=1 Tax=Polyangium mundeleinium TaxID=2995306 RepID=A0ABT5END4_9BACT|nr:prolyl oligopeptidase family serine peptidase [Polyangium mundeleinium]MDC0743344.1 prolyl oligopeptidase family serine peptidase [Polyangium mundeleinium]
MRPRLLLPLVLAALAGPSACRPPAEHGVEQRPPPRAEPSAQSPAVPDAAPGAVCTPGEGRCTSEEVALVCQGGERWVEERCGEGSTCLGAGCVSLRAQENPPVGLAREALLAPQGEGWLDAWSAVGPLPGPLPEAEATTPPDAGAPPAPRPLCAKDGYVEVHEKADSKKGPKPPTHFVLSGHLVSGRAQRILLAAGVSGRVRISVAGKRVFDATREADPAPFRDETRVPLDLDRGVHRILVEVEQPTSAPTGFWLRARSPSGGPAPDLLFATPPEATCTPAELLRAEIQKKPTATGFDVSVRPAWLGLGPRKPLDLPYRAELAPEKGPGRPLAEGSLPAASLGTPEGAISLSIPFEKTGANELRLRLGATPGTEQKIPLVYRGSLQKRVLALTDKRETIESSSATRGEKDSLIAHIDGLVDNLAQNDPDISWIKRQTEEAESLLASLEKGESPYAGRFGIQRRAYRSPLDGRLQPYVLFVPRAYRPGGKPLPLVVASHGLGNRPEIALRVVVGEAPEAGFNGLLEARHFSGLPDFGAFLVAPWQFGNAGQRHLGEDDVLRAVAEVRAHFPIDERRISITGYSLGGTVAFYLPFHYPDLFSAAAPLCGYPNLLGWESIRKAPHTPWENVLLAKRYIVNWAENGQHVPLFIVHGGKDDPTRSQLVADRYRSLGYPYKFDVQEDLDHNVWDYGYEDGDMIGWLKSHRRPKAPERVRFVTGEWRYDRAHWVRLLGMEAEDKFAEIDARHSKADGVTVKTRNVESFALDLSQLALREGAGVAVDGAAIEGPFAAGMLWLVKKDGAFVRVPEEPSRKGRKRAGVSGPLDDIDRHGRLVVYGTQDPAQIETNRLVAEHFASFDTFAARFPVKSDVEITDAEIDTRSLVLIGNTRSNRVTALLESALPVRFEPSALTFRGKRHEGEDVGVSFIHPHPRNPDEYVVVHAGVGSAGTLASRHLPRFAPDFVVYDGRITVQRGGHVLDRRVALDGGFFGIDWN